MEERMAFHRLAANPVKFRLFLLTRLPSAWFAGLRVKSISDAHCEVSVPFKWFTKNPFRSTYFACLAMAAEMSTGALAMAEIYKRKPSVSMLVISLSAAYFKKATGITYFRCDDGAAFKDAVTAAIETGEMRTVRAVSTGRNQAGEEVARFEIEWSFKVKRK